MAKASSIVARQQVWVVVWVVIAAVTALTIVAPGASSAEPPEIQPTTSTVTEWDSECFGRATNGISQTSSISTAVRAIGPSVVGVDRTFTTRLAPQTFAPLESEWHILVPEPQLFNVSFDYGLPGNAHVEEVNVVPGTSVNVLGEPTVAIEGDRIVLTAPATERPTGENPQNKFKLPAIDVTLTPTEEPGSIIEIGVPGHDEDSASFRFELSSPPFAKSRCWPEDGDGPALSTTTIAEGDVVIFDDVTPDDEHYASIAWASDIGVTTGFPDGMFRPSDTLTRQAMSAFLYRVVDEPDGPDPQCETAPFHDVDLENDFCGEITWMKADGITTGNPSGLFNPTGGLSRQAMSAFLYRLAGEPDGPDPQCESSPFPDVTPGNAFCGEIAWMAETGISEGFDDGDYRPEATLTRQAMTAFLHRYTLVVQTVA